MSIGIRRSLAWSSELAGFLDGEDGAALVLAALGAGAVGELALAAVGADGEAGGVRKSWLRRLAVRCLEWRRFGLGIAVSLSEQPAADA